jgi:hypothetical protein
VGALAIALAALTVALAALVSSHANDAAPEARLATQLKLVDRRAAAPAAIPAAAATEPASTEPTATEPTEITPSVVTDGTTVERAAARDTPTTRTTTPRTTTPRTTGAAARSTAPADAASPRTLEGLMGRAVSPDDDPLAGLGSATTTTSPLLPATPTRSAVLNALRSVEGEVAACSLDDAGMTTVRVVFQGASGRVGAVHTSGLSPSTAACIERAVAHVELDPFERERFEISFPYRL